MIGIIYRFTIIAKYKINGYKPFYIGQHWEKRSVEHFLSNKVYSLKNYEGSGTLWCNLIKKLKNDFGDKKWRCFVKREVLFKSENITPSGLDKLEEFFIKKEHALFKEKLGGCNLIETSCIPYKYHSGDAIKRMSNSLKKFYSENPELHPMLGRKHSEETKRHWSKIRKGKMMGEDNPFYGNHSQSGENNPFFGKRHSEETKRKHSEFMKEYYRTHTNPWKGKHRVISEEQRKKQSQTMHNKIWITNGLRDKWHNASSEIPDGWKRGRTNNKKDI
jgi:hypothetical protein